MSDLRSILVTGSNGALGRAVVRCLASSGIRNLIAASRSPVELADVDSLEIQTRRMDFDDAASLESGFSGVSQALLISTDALAVPGFRQQQHRSALAAAVRSGVKHIAYTSMPNPVASGVIPFAADHVVMEAELKASGVQYSSLRNSWYQENLLAYLPHIVKDGTWFTAAGDGSIAHVSRHDAAEAAALVVRSEKGFLEIDVAGPETLTIDEIAAVASSIFERPIRVEHVTTERMVRELSRQGVDAGYIQMIAVTDANQRLGNFSVNSTKLETLIGRPPLPLSDFFRRNSETFLGLLNA